MAVNAIYQKNGSKPRIKKRNQDYRNEFNWHVTNDERYIMRYILEKGDHSYIGGYYKNIWFRIWKYHKDEYMKIKGMRNMTENLHSILKEQLLFE